MTELGSAVWKASGTALVFRTNTHILGHSWFWFCFSESGSHRSKTELELSVWPKVALNFSPSCVQPLSAAYSMVFLGDLFPSDMGEGKIYRIYNYHQRNNAKWWLPRKQRSLQITSKAMQKARTQTVSY